MFKHKIHALEYADKEKLSFWGVTVEKSKDEFEIIDKFQENTQEAIIDKIGKGNAIHLIVTGKNVIRKQLAYDSETNNELISQAFPNLNIDDFFVQILKVNHKAFVSICRKSYIEGIIETFKKENVWVISFSIGKLILSSVTSFIKESFETRNELVICEVDEIIEFKPKTGTTSKEYSIGDAKVSQDYLIPLAAICNEIIGSTVLSTTYDKEEVFLKKQYKETVFFKKTLTYGIGGLLFLLIINFLVFNNAYKKWQLLEEEVQLYSSQREQILQKKEEVAQKEAIVMSILNTGFSKSSWYLSEIVKKMPTTITLENYAYQPLKRSVRKDKAIQLHSDQIKIKGETLSKVDFNDWLRQLEELKFIVDITILNYGNNQKGDDFEVLIKIKKHETAS